MSSHSVLGWQQWHSPGLEAGWAQMASWGPKSPSRVQGQSADWGSGVKATRSAQLTNAIFQAV